MKVWSIKDFGGSMKDQKKDSAVSGVYEGLLASKVWQEMVSIKTGNHNCWLKMVEDC